MWRVYLFAFFLTVSGISHAKDFSYGVLPYFGSFSVDDPEGESETAEEFYVLNFVATYETARNRRLWSELGFIEFDTQASVTEVSQDVEQWYFLTAYQFRLVLSRSFKPWLGAGLVLAQSEYSGRFTTDEDGFLDQSFPARDETEFGYTLQIMHDIELENNRFDLVAGIAYTDSFDDGLQGFKIQFGILF